MSMQPWAKLTRLTLAGALAATAVGAGGAIAVAQDEEPFQFGMILVGPQDDRGWSQAHREAGEYVEEQLGAEMILLDKVNTADRPELTVDQVAFDTGHTPSAIRNWPARYGLQTVDGRYRWADIRQLMETRGNRQAS